jgi:hypothetical protein
MPKKNWFMVLVLLVLGTVYAYYFTDWFRPKVIRIFHTSRSTRRAMRQNASPETVPVLFGLDANYRLTEIKVIPLTEWQTNKNSPPLWHLLSDSNSIPLKAFSYGQPIRGMKPALTGTRAEPLEPNVTYHLILKAGGFKGEHDFETKPAETDDPPTP